MLDLDRCSIYKKGGVIISKLKGWDFPVRIDEETGRIKTAEDDENIKKGVYIILNTSNNERKGVPNFGADIKPLLFNAVDTTLTMDLESRASDAIRRYEEHIKSLDIEVDESESSKGIVNVKVSYTTDINDQVNKLEQNFNIENSD